MINDLEKAIEAIEWLRSNPSSNNETQTREDVITPILKSLGWGEAPGEIRMKYLIRNVESGRVDYALCGKRGEPVVFIEAKKLGGAGDLGVGQLFSYAHKQGGIQLLILTDGDLWDFYLTMGKGNYPERFYQAILSENRERTEKYAQHFEKYLGKDRVYSGAAIKAAEKQHRSNLGKEEVRKNILTVWNTMLEESDSDLQAKLRDILADAVGNKCGIRPDKGDLDNFLRERITSVGTVTPRPPKSRFVKIISADDLIPREKIVGYFYGKENEFGISYMTLAEIIKELAKRDSGFMLKVYNDPRTTGTRRCLVSRDPEELYTDGERLVNNPRIDLQNGWYLHTALDNKSIIRYTKVVCEIADVKYGSELYLFRMRRRTENC